MDRRLSSASNGSGQPLQTRRSKRPVRLLLLLALLVLIGSSGGGLLAAEEPPAASTETLGVAVSGDDPSPSKATAASEEDASARSLSGMLPEGAGLFAKDAVDVGALSQMDCHLRNIDFCYAGLLGASNRALPETSAELEARCDEIRFATSCMGVYNRRCQTLKVFSVLAPMAANFDSAESGPLANQEEAQVAAVAAAAAAASGATASANASAASAGPASLTGQLANVQLPDELDSALGGSGGAPIAAEADQQDRQRLKFADLSSICSPRASGTRANKLLRGRLFRLARCVNGRIPLLSPCIEDLKSAVQLFYEPRRSLPLKPTCCALARFRNCSMAALDGVCGLSSFAQLEGSLQSAGGPASMLRSVERACRQAASFDSPYCVEVLPPSGLKAPQRRGHRASKLAKALDLVSFAPAAQIQ